MQKNKHILWHFFSNLFILVLAFSWQAVLAKNVCNKPFVLSTNGNRIVNSCGETFKLKSVNWYGAHLEAEVVGGLDKQPLNYLVNLIKTGGFNSVRLTFSNQMLHDKKIVDEKYLKANPTLIGKTPIQIFDEVIKALTDAGIIVILNNHTTSSEWCCGFDYNGLWHHPDYQSTEQWINDWLMLVTRYRSNPYVAGVDLRNEVRTMHFYKTIFPVYPNWGKGDENDWKLAATNAANAIHNINPNLLIIVEGINWYGVPLINGYRPMLTPIKNNPLVLNQKNKLVYEVHVYGFTGPKHTGDDKSSPGQQRYSDMDEKTLRQTYYDEFAYVLEEGHDYTAPIWVGEFGVIEDANGADKVWFKRMMKYLDEKNLSWGYWALNPERADGAYEGFGLLNSDWSAYREDWRMQELQKLMG